MPRWSTFVIAAATLGASACSCGEPELPPPPDETETETGDTSVAHTADTAPPPPCDVPETESNDTPPEANLLPTDRLGCGGFGVDGDFDYWLVDVAEPSWVEVRVERENASLADVGVLVTGESGQLAVGRDDGIEDPDVLLLFPAPADLYTISVREEQAKSGDRYRYEVSASIAKNPVFFDADGAAIDWVEEVEPNDDVATAPSLRHGDAILGASDVGFDIDWFRIGIPAGKHTLTFRVQAWKRGSGGDFTLVLFDEELKAVRTQLSGDPPSDPDPYLVYNSDGDEVLYLQVREAENKGNPAIWYLLETYVETQ